MGGQVVLRASADRPGSKPPAVAFDAIELDGSCHGSRVLHMGIWQIIVTISYKTNVQKQGNTEIDLVRRMRSRPDARAKGLLAPQEKPSRFAAVFATRSNDQMLHVFRRIRRDPA